MRLTCNFWNEEGHPQRYRSQDMADDCRQSSSKSKTIKWNVAGVSMSQLAQMAYYYNHSACNDIGCVDENNLVHQPIKHEKEIKTI